MNKHTLLQKFQPSDKDLILNFLIGNAVSVIEDSENITNTYILESSKIQGIKYFLFTDTISGFSNLQSNWYSYGVDVISETAIDSSLETLNYLFTKGLLSNGIKVSVFPMRDGGIQFEFDGKDICAELEINQIGELTFIMYDDDGNIIDKGQLFELSQLSSLLEEAAYA